MRGPNLKVACGRLLRCFPVCIQSHAIDEARFFDEFKEDPLPPDKLCGRIKLGHLAAVEDHDPIGVKNSVDSMCNRDDGPILEDIAAQGRLKQGVRLDVNGSLTNIEQCVSEYAPTTISWVGQ